MYLFVRETNFQIAARATENCMFSIASSTSTIISFEASTNSWSNVETGAVCAGMVPSKYLLIIATVRFNKFPKSLAKS